VGWEQLQQAGVILDKGQGSSPFPDTHPLSDAEAVLPATKAASFRSELEQASAAPTVASGAVKVQSSMADIDLMWVVCGRQNPTVLQYAHSPLKVPQKTQACHEKVSDLKHRPSFSEWRR
jgi:hypothetical protein